MRQDQMDDAISRRARVVVYNGTGAPWFEGEVFAGNYGPTVHVECSDGTRHVVPLTLRIDILADPCGGNTRGGSGCSCDPPFGTHGRVEPDEVAAAVRRQVLTEAANAARNAFGDPAWSPTAQRFVSVASVIGEGS